MCIDLCSSCFHTTKAFVKPRHSVTEQGQSNPTVATELLTTKLQPLSSSICSISSSVQQDTLIVNVQTANYGTLFILSSQSCLLFCSVVSLLQNQTLSVPFSQSNSSLVRIHRTHHLSNAKLIANIIHHAFSTRLSIGLIVNRWCQQIKYARAIPKRFRRPGGPRYRLKYQDLSLHYQSHQALKIQINASDRSQLFQSTTTSNASPTLLGYSVSDYAFLSSVSKLGAIGIKVVVLIS